MQVLATVPAVQFMQVSNPPNETRCAGNFQSWDIPGKHMPRSFYPPCLPAVLHLTHPLALVRHGADGLWLLAAVMLDTNLTMGLYSFLWPPQFPRIVLEWGVLC